MTTEIDPSSDRHVHPGPWSTPPATSALEGEIPVAVPQARAGADSSRRRPGWSALLFAILMFALIGGQAWQDLSGPDAFAYWRDYFLSPSLATSVSRLADGRTALVVSGRIGPAAAEAFRGALNEARLGRDGLVVLSSPGGNLDQSVFMGEAIRARGLTTAVGKVDGDGRLRPSYCASACVFAFAGGASRLGVPGSILGVHRFTTTATGPDIVAQTQRTTGLILGYMTRMGVSPKVVELMSATAEIQWLDIQEARRLDLVTTLADGR